VLGGSRLQQGRACPCQQARSRRSSPVSSKGEPGGRSGGQRRRRSMTPAMPDEVTARRWTRGLVDVTTAHGKHPPPHPRSGGPARVAGEKRQSSLETQKAALNAIAAVVTRHRDDEARRQSEGDNPSIRDDRAAPVLVQVDGAGKSQSSSASMRRSSRWVTRCQSALTGATSWSASRRAGYHGARVGRGRRELVDGVEPVAGTWLPRGRRLGALRLGLTAGVRAGGGVRARACP